MSVGKLKQQITAGRLTPCAQPVPPDPCPEPGSIPFIMLKFFDLDWTGGEFENVAWWNTTLNNAGSYVNFNAVTVMGNRVFLYGNLDDVLSLCLPNAAPLEDVAIHPLENCLRFISLDHSLIRFDNLNAGTIPLQNIRLDYGSIMAFIPGEFSELRTLTISNNQIGYVVIDCPLLTYADFSGNQIADLNSPNAPVLETLYLANNLLANKSVLVNTDLSNLKVLDLSGNYLDNIDLSHTPGLTSLKLNGQNVTMPQLDLSPVTGLITLEAKSCGLESVIGIRDVVLTDASEFNFENNSLDKFTIAEILSFARENLPLAINKLYLHGGTNYDISADVGLVILYNDLKAAGVDIKCNPYD